jgi:hypothetical protein
MLANLSAAIADLLVNEGRVLINLSQSSTRLANQADLYRDIVRQSGAPQLQLAAKRHRAGAPSPTTAASLRFRRATRMAACRTMACLRVA